jgi:hypothetical protein
VRLTLHAGCGSIGVRHSIGHEGWSLSTAEHHKSHCHLVWFPWNGLCSAVSSCCWCPGRPGRCGWVLLLRQPCLSQPCLSDCGPAGAADGDSNSSSGSGGDSDTETDDEDSSDDEGSSRRRGKRSRRAGGAKGSAGAKGNRQPKTLEERRRHRCVQQCSCFYGQRSCVGCCGS